jgi:DNA-binding NarL/FixJ family response regulator
MRKGACGYLSKAATAEQLVIAVEKVSAGEVVRAPSSAIKRHMADWPGMAHGLTPREAEVVALIGTGMSNEEMAEVLYLNLNSVRALVRTAQARIGVEHRLQTVRWATENGLDQPSRTAAPAPHVA